MSRLEDCKKCDIRHCLQLIIKVQEFTTVSVVFIKASFMRRIKFMLMNSEMNKLSLDYSKSVSMHCI